MSAFTIVHHDCIAGKLTCFDRLIFKGHLTRLYQPGGMKGFLDSQGVLLKHFAAYVTKMTVALKAHAKESCARAGRPYQYLATTFTRRGGASKEDLARSIAERDHVTEGLVCVLAAVEPCMSFEVHKNAATFRLELRRRARKCRHFHWYFIHPDLGFCHVRLLSCNAIVNCANWGLAQRLSDRLCARR